MSLTTSPPMYGRRLIPQILDDLASSDPDRIIYSIASFTETSHEFREISARSFAKSVDKTAWWLQNQLGTSENIQPVGYIGPRKSSLNRPLVGSLVLQALTALR